MTKEDFQMESNLVKQKLDSTKEKGIAPVFCIPFIQHDILLGVVEVGKIQRRSKEERDLLLIYQSLGSMALDNARLFDQLSTKDRLTGLYNRRFFDERAVTEVNRARRFGHRVSFAIMDLDNYLAFLESNGVVAGDKLLTRVGSLLNEHVRKIDITCRLDEDIFAAILLETEKPQAVQFAEKIRKIINEDAVIKDQLFSHQQITVSIAIMTFPDDGITIPPLMEKAYKVLSGTQVHGGNVIISNIAEDEAK
jgi:diguanylate cyclase (GGDEF)-like protein